MAERTKNCKSFTLGIAFWATFVLTSLIVGPLASADDKTRILFLGDSLTKGYGLTPAEAYPALIQKKIEKAKLPFVAVNAGVSGDTTAGGARRLGWLLKKPVGVLVLALGGNDGLRGVDPSEMEKNLVSIIEQVRKKNPKVRILVAGVQMPDNMGAAYQRKFEAVFPALARKHKTALIPVLLKGVEADPKLNQDDQIHPNAKGQAVVAETVWKALEPVLKKKDDPDPKSG